MKTLLFDNSKFLFRLLFTDIFKIKKILVICLFALSNFVIAQNDADNRYIYSSIDETSEEDTFPGSPADPNPVPIDDYVPALFIFGVAFAIRYSFKKQTSIK